jgi:hypothetical protein
MTSQKKQNRRNNINNHPTEKQKEGEKKLFLKE